MVQEWSYHLQNDPKRSPRGRCREPSQEVEILKNALRVLGRHKSHLLEHSTKLNSFYSKELFYVNNLMIHRDKQVCVCACNVNLCKYVRALLWVLWALVWGSEVNLRGQPSAFYLVWHQPSFHVFSHLCFPSPHRHVLGSRVFVPLPGTFTSLLVMELRTWPLPSPRLVQQARCLLCQLHGPLLNLMMSEDDSWDSNKLFLDGKHVTRLCFGTCWLCLHLYFWSPT